MSYSETEFLNPDFKVKKILKIASLISDIEKLVINVNKIHHV